MNAARQNENCYVKRHAACGEPGRWIVFRVACSIHSIVCVCVLGFVNSALAASEPLVNHGDIWEYRKGTNAPQANWKTASDADLDATWLAGAGGFGYADNAPETANCQTILSDMPGNYTTVYLRRQFTVTNDLSPDAHLMLRMDWDDGYIAWLDGVYLTSANVGGAPTEPASDATADANHESSLGNTSPQPATVSDLGNAATQLGVGTHTLAIIGLNRSSSSSDFIQVPDLYLDVPPPAVTNVWAVSDSPIVLTSNVTVTNNEVLLIEPGVTVESGAGINITVADGGRLLAEGTSNAPILFTRSGASGYWGHLTVNGSVGSPETRIVHAR